MTILLDFAMEIVQDYKKFFSKLPVQIIASSLHLFKGTLARDFGLLFFS
jgi:hypothetical protein